MVWRLFLNRLPTKDSLIRRNVPLDVNDMTWVFCRDHNEFVEHVFISCKEIHALWIALIGWTALMLLRGIWELIFIRFHHAFGHNLRGKNGKLYVVRWFGQSGIVGIIASLIIRVLRKRNYGRIFCIQLGHCYRGFLKDLDTHIRSGVSLLVPASIRE